jgi:3-oxoacyl-[acyl-carrier-protein] synthase I
MTGAAILATSVLCAAGFGAEQVWAASRTRVSRVRNSNVMDAHLEPIPMGLVPDDALDPDDEELDSLALPARARRMLRLASPPLRELAPDLQEAPVALYLGLPELSPEVAPWIETLSQHLLQRVGLELDTAASRTFPLGRAAALVALEQALAALSADPGRPILVGGVDSYLDLRLLATLGSEGRVHGPRVMDGFVPGEGAAFLWIKATSTNDAARIQAAASATDPGHRYGTEPARGEGLAEAVEALRYQVPGSSGPVATIFAGLNGESFEAKSWGVARLRHKDFFAPETSMQHPADCFGDTGAATGAIFTAMAGAALSKGHRSGPALIWAASDHGSRACALVTATPPTGN